jgi:hypothetical protein
VVLSKVCTFAGSRSDTPRMSNDVSCVLRVKMSVSPSWAIAHG